MGVGALIGVAIHLGGWIFLAFGAISLVAFLQFPMQIYPVLAPFLFSSLTVKQANLTVIALTISILGVALFFLGKLVVRATENIPDQINRVLGVLLGVAIGYYAERFFRGAL